MEDIQGAIAKSNKIGRKIYYLTSGLKILLLYHSMGDEEGFESIKSQDLISDCYLLKFLAQI
jgi:hypothetical protein